MKNVLGREIPERLGERKLRLFEGAFATTPNGRKADRPQKVVKPGENKVLPSIEQAIEKTGLSDGMTISFHHSFRQ